MMIESIREHGVSLYSLGGMQFSQAQVISLGLMLFGVLGWLWAGKSPMKMVSQEKVD